MKFNTLDLKVIKVKIGDDFHYFICKPKMFLNCYIDIFTGKKINVKNDLCVRELSDCLKALNPDNCITDKAFMLTKEELLVVYVKINNYLNSIENNTFGTDNYKMKDYYDADNLVVANLQRLSSTVTEFGPMIETTEEKYIFEVIAIEEEIKYREVFTGFIANDYKEYFDLPYVVSPVPYTDFFPDQKRKKIPKLCLIWDINDINFLSKNIKSKKLKNK